VRLRKLAEPVAPNRLPEAPLPNAAPMSAPLPCCISTRPMIASATRIWTSEGEKKASSCFRLSICRKANRQKIIRNQRSPTDQTAIDIRLHEQFTAFCLDTTAVQNRNPFATFPSAPPPGPDGSMHLLRLSSGDAVTAGPDGPHRFISNHGAAASAATPSRCRAPPTSAAHHRQRSDPDSRSASVSPTHRMGTRPSRSAPPQTWPPRPHRSRRTVHAARNDRPAHTTTELTQHRCSHFAGKGALTHAR
jgi:hypothetical protein